MDRDILVHHYHTLFIWFLWSRSASWHQEFAKLCVAELREARALRAAQIIPNPNNQLLSALDLEGFQTLDLKRPSRSWQLLIDLETVESEQATT